MWCCHYLKFVAFLQITSALVAANDSQNEVIEEFENNLPTVETTQNYTPNKHEIVKFPMTGNNLVYNRISNMNSPNRNNYMNANFPNTYYIKDTRIPEANFPNIINNQISPYNVISFTRPKAAEYAANMNFQPKADIFAVLDSSSNPDIDLTNREGIKTVFGWKPKTISLNIGDPYAVRGNNDNSKFYLQIMVDNVEIHGTLSVSGSLPIHGTVAVNGNVPNEGKAFVNYSSGSSKKSVST